MKNLSDMTQQECFDAALLHARTQNQKSLDESGNFCMYRGKSGLKCFAGIFIPDDKYSDEFEFKEWACLTTQGHVDSTHSNLVERLQVIHDCFEPDNWEERLKKLAEDSGLTYKENRNED